MSTDDIIARAYSDYTQSVSDSYAKVMNAVTEVTSGVDTDTADVRTYVTETVLPSLSQQGMAVTEDTLIPLNDGVYNFVDLLTSIGEAVKTKTALIDAGESAGLQAIAEVEDITGRVKTFSLSDLMEQMNGTFHSVVVDHAVAYAHAFGSSITEKVQLFRDTMMEKFSSAYSDFSNTLAAAVQQIKKGVGIVDYVKSKLSLSGLKAAFDFGTPYEQSYDATYTGATPASAYAMYAAGNMIVSATGRALQIISGVVCKTFGAILAATGAVVRRGIDAVIQATVNPYDVECIDKKGNFTYDQFFLQAALAEPHGSGAGYEMLDTLREGPLKTDDLACEWILQLTSETTTFDTAFTDLTTGLSVIAKTVTGSTVDVSSGLLTGVIGVISAYDPSFAGTTYDDAIDWLEDNLSVSGGTLPYPGSAETTYLGRLNAMRLWAKDHSFDVVTAMAKVKPIRHELVQSFLEHPDWSTGLNDAQYRYTTVTKFLDQLAATECHTNVNRSEWDFLLDHIAGWVVSELIGWAEYCEYTYIDSQLENAIIVIDPEGPLAILQHEEMAVTNKDFFDVITAGKFDISRAGTEYINIPSGMYHRLELVRYFFTDKAQNQYDYQFWPYCHVDVSWSNPSFSLKSDQQNAQAFENFFAAALVITAVAVASIVIFTKLKKAAWRASAQLMGAEWNLTDAASKGENVSGYLKAYKKARMKSNILNALTGNLVSAGEDAYQKSKNVMAGANLDQVVSLITGDPI